MTGPWTPWPAGHGERCSPLPGRPDVVVHRAPAIEPDPVATDLLDDAERARLERLRRPEDRARFATARVVARTALGELLGLAPQDVPLVVRATVGATAPERDGAGRPTVAGVPMSLSIAHAGDVVLVAIAGSMAGAAPDTDRRAPPAAGSTRPAGDAPTPGHPPATLPVVVGVDVEGGPGRPSGTADLWDLAATPDEQDRLRALDAGDRDDAFLALWTRKEAVLKACGRGLTVPMTSLAVSLDPDARLLSATSPVPGPERTTLLDLDVGAGYRAALAVVGG